VPKIIGKSLSEHREQVRARVFDVLRHQLYERGFDAITLASVAAEAKLGRTAIYNHFPDKESLLVAFVEDEATRSGSSFEFWPSTTCRPVPRSRPRWPRLPTGGSPRTPTRSPASCVRSSPTG
jgi:AcrR family transcriptional regulator